MAPTPNPQPVEEAQEPDFIGPKDWLEQDNWLQDVEWYAPSARRTARHLLALLRKQGSIMINDEFRRRLDLPPEEVEDGLCTLFSVCLVGITRRYLLPSEVFLIRATHLLPKRG